MKKRKRLFRFVSVLLCLCLMLCLSFSALGASYTPVSSFFDIYSRCYSYSSSVSCSQSLSTSGSVTKLTVGPSSGITDVHLDLTSSATEYIPLDLGSTYVFTILFNDIGSWNSRMDSLIISFGNLKGGFVGKEASFKPVNNPGGQLGVGVLASVVVSYSDMYDPVHDLSCISYISIDIGYSSSVTGNRVYSFYSFSSDAYSSSAEIPQYTPPDTGNMDDVEGAEDSLMDDNQQGLDNAGEYQANAVTAIAQYVGGFQVLSSVVGKIVSIPFLNGLILLSVAVGLFAFALGIPIAALSYSNREARNEARYQRRVADSERRNEARYRRRLAEREARRKSSSKK